MSSISDETQRRMLELLHEAQQKLSESEPTEFDTSYSVDVLNSNNDDITNFPVSGQLTKSASVRDEQLGGADLGSRTKAFLKKKEEKLAKEREKIKQMEEEQISGMFKPKLISSRSHLRTEKSLIDRQSEYETKKLLKLASIAREELDQENSELTFRPEITRRAVLSPGKIAPIFHSNSHLSKPTAAPAETIAARMESEFNSFVKRMEKAREDKARVEAALSPRSAANLNGNYVGRTTVPSAPHLQTAVRASKKNLMASPLKSLGVKLVPVSELRQGSYNLSSDWGSTTGHSHIGSDAASLTHSTPYFNAEEDSYSTVTSHWSHYVPEVAQYMALRYQSENGTKSVQPSSPVNPLMTDTRSLTTSENLSVNRHWTDDEFELLSARLDNGSSRSNVDLPLKSLERDLNLTDSNQIESSPFIDFGDSMMNSNSITTATPAIADIPSGMTDEAMMMLSQAIADAQAKIASDSYFDVAPSS